MDIYDYSLERKLKELDSDLHQRFVDTVFALQKILSNYKLIFPDFTDHTELHSLNIIDFCNRLIGKQIDKLNADEIYVLLLGCYFHDTGMGISHNDFDEFSKQIDFGNYFETHSHDNYPEIVRNFHHEFSGLFLHKYARFFDFPSDEHLFAIIQISRGHRKTDLFDRKDYPLSLTLPNGNTICLPYLAALVRLADEIDVTASRNSKAIYDLNKIVEEIDLIEFMKHDAVKDLEIKEDEFIMSVSTDDRKIFDRLTILASKMKKTLDYCRSAVNDITPYEITQKDVIIKRV
ncbi:MAG: hypothetical protein IJR08_04940 [Bacilli bacterium]|nr:hypothetical protein [Bacilli bacterium]